MLTSYSKRIPFFSIIMCTFNRNHLICRALDSLLLQREKDWECIIVDDGSDEEFIDFIVGKYNSHLRSQKEKDKKDENKDLWE